MDKTSLALMQFLADKCTTCRLRTGCDSICPLPDDDIDTSRFFRLCECEKEANLKWLMKGEI